MEKSGKELKAAGITKISEEDEECKCILFWYSHSIFLFLRNASNASTIELTAIQCANRAARAFAFTEVSDWLNKLRTGYICLSLSDAANNWYKSLKRNDNPIGDVCFVSILIRFVDVLSFHSKQAWHDTFPMLKCCDRHNRLDYVLLSVCGRRCVSVVVPLFLLLRFFEHWIRENCNFPYFSRFQPHRHVAIMVQALQVHWTQWNLDHAKKCCTWWRFNRTWTNRMAIIWSRSIPMKRVAPIRRLFIAHSRTKRATNCITADGMRAQVVTKLKRAQPSLTFRSEINWFCPLCIRIVFMCLTLEGISANQLCTRRSMAAWCSHTMCRRRIQRTVWPMVQF